MHQVRPPLRIVDEWSPLEVVCVGIGVGMGPPPALAETYDPKSREHVIAGTFPTESSVRAELEGFRALLSKLGIEVLTPAEVGTNQVFTRDIGFVLEDRFVVTSMVADRAAEQQALDTLLAQIPDHQIITPPEGVRLEGGDVMPIDGELWVGHSGPEDFERFTTARTNTAALDWLATTFPNWNVRGFELQKSDTNPRKNALHLDCCLGLLGDGHALMHPEGFKNPSDLAFLRRQFPTAQRLEITAEEMYDMNCNLFSISPNDVVSEMNFERVNAQLRMWGYRVHTVAFNQTAKMEGLLRCTTLPLRRQS